ncbi:hypothetical protein [Undibacterium terreum]|uniref:hypothetical protein n=1 Tax=Undibacterium terreum TaxID=1224302 RepID=UPI00166BEC6D|nr:hypothetical protein [Undibacterium terreum]
MTAVLPELFRIKIFFLANLLCASNAFALAEKEPEKVTVWGASVIVRPSSSADVGQPNPSNPEAPQFNGSHFSLTSSQEKLIDQFLENSLKPPEVTWDKIFSVGTGTLALIVSISLGIYTKRKDSRARKHSIEDDYWLRKVIGPIAIEPLLKTVVEMTAAVPAPFGDANFDQSKITPFLDSYKSKVLELSLGLSALSLIDQGLAKTAREGLDKIEDLLIEYCAANELGINREDDTKPGDKAMFLGQVRTEVLEILQQIKLFQSKLA